MLPGTNLTFGSIVNVVLLGDSDVAKLSKVVLMMLCSETPPNFFSSCLFGESVVCSVCEIGVAEATPENVRAPITPTKAPLRYLRSRIRSPLSRRRGFRSWNALRTPYVPSITRSLPLQARYETPDEATPPRHRPRGISLRRAPVGGTVTGAPGSKDP